MVLVLAVASKRDGRVVGGCVLIKVLGEIYQALIDLRKTLGTPDPWTTLS